LVHSAPNLNAKGGTTAALGIPEAATAAGSSCQQQPVGHGPHWPQKPPPIRFASGNSSGQLKQQDGNLSSSSSSQLTVTELSSLNLSSIRHSSVPLEFNIDGAADAGQLKIWCKQQQQQQSQVHIPLSPAAAPPGHVDGSGGSVVSQVLQRELSNASATAGASRLAVLHLALHSVPEGQVCGWQQQVTAVVEPGEDSPADHCTESWDL
jgi:hypothetical protein